MNGAEILLRTLVTNGVDTCFANPGTSEMHFVAALDRVPGMRPVLALQENVATGAADGYGRMTGRPACTLLHLGPGLANGLANLHNARRASSPVINVVGDHAAAHLQYDAPLTSDIKGFARPVSDWVHSSSSARNIAADTAMAVKVALEHPGRIATLILPADTAWTDAEGVGGRIDVPVAQPVPGETVDRIAKLLGQGRKIAIIMRGNALQERGLDAAGKIAAHTGARLMCDTFTPRLQRGAGRVPVERLPYFSEKAVEFLTGTDVIILVGTTPPVSFFAYPDKASWLTPAGCQLAVLAQPQEDGIAALEALVEACGATEATPARAERKMPQYELTGPLSPGVIMSVVARHLPQNAIIADESASSGFPYYEATATAEAHDYLNLTGGAIGSMMAVSIGAAVACPDRKVVTLQGDGSAMYILPALWTQARENLDIVTVIYANRAYRILNNELKRVGAENHGSNAASLMSLENPSIDWVQVAGGLGVGVTRAETPAEFEEAFAHAMRERGPHVIEAILYCG
ncbi:acetolactate synthase large subunit protein [Rhizobium sp. CIAT894]|uniref:acetolactate synthase large subunit n=1 Tax=Rhizobium sp. CIAT894 TaxID=2020312 RepID=UPI000A1F629B|nr:acetolactate synthase large subunit [Rhizobium sp. CIAT894]ARM90246.1 acetolactate synthase large subunit protein [Rhizobium sp. CIAT894]